MAGPSSPPSGGDPAGSSPSGDYVPPTLRAQFDRTRASVVRLLSAHVALARAELAIIGDRAKVAAALIGAAVGLLVFGATLVAIGTPLFVGEWLFGSIGWGVLHGFLLTVAVAVMALMLALEIPPGSVAAAFFASLVAGAVVGAGLVFNVPNAAWTALGDAAVRNTTLAIDPGPRPLVVGTVAVGAVVALLGLVAGLRGGGISGGIAGLVAGAVVGAALGAFSAMTFSPHVAVAIGVTVGLALWPILMARPVYTGTYDWEALRARYWPGVTIGAARETLDILQARMPEMPAKPPMPTRRSGR